MSGGEEQQILQIPHDEISIRVSTSRGPGGQNVNRVRTRVTVAFNVLTSRSLSDSQRQLILERLGRRISRAGILQVRSQRHRTQRQNRAAAENRLRELLAEAVRPVTGRQKVRPSRASKERRLEEKRRRSQLKNGRRTEQWETD